MKADTICCYYVPVKLSLEKHPQFILGLEFVPKQTTSVDNNQGFVLVAVRQFHLSSGL